MSTQGTETRKVERHKWPPELGTSDGQINHWVEFSGFDFNKKAKTCDIALYIPPDALHTGYKSEYKQLEMGAGGVAAAQNAKGGEAGMGDILGAAKDMLFGQFSEGLEAAAERLLAKATPETIAVLRSRQTGKIVNPHMVSQYQGPTDQRVHKFTFQMMPKSENEAKDIQKIVRQFKTAMLPSNANADAATAPSGFWGYPDEFEINFFINGNMLDETNSLFRIGRSALTDMDLDYTTQDTVAFFEGSPYPVTTEMTLSFQEIWMQHRGLAEIGY